MNRRILTLMVALVPIVAFGLMLAVVTVPFVSLGPGPTFNTLGCVPNDGGDQTCAVGSKPVVDIEGIKTEPTSGHLNMTTVAQRDNLTLGQALTLWMSGREQLIPRDLVYPPDRSREDVKKVNDADFKESENDAEDAALGYLKYAPAVTVGGVTDPGPSADKLRSGDAIDAVNGTPVAHREQVIALLNNTKAGDQLVVNYRRRNAPPGVTTVTLGANPNPDADPDPDPDANPNRGYLGVTLEDRPWAPFTIDFNLANIGGPSAGLMFSLAVVDKLTTGNLNSAKFVAGTGTISSDGKVGPIGGITHKMLAAREAGATVFLVPAENCVDARSDGQRGLELVKVGTLGEAVNALKTISAGGEPPRC